MTSTATKLPDNINELKDIAHRYEVENNILREQVRLLKAQLFGRKTEKVSQLFDNNQVLLFNEIEEVVCEVKKEEEEDVPGYKRKKRGRKPIPEHFPRVEVIHDISEEEKRCACGQQKTCSGKEISEQIDIIPAKVKVIRNIRLKYVCRNCEGVEADEPAVKIAPLPKQIIPKSMATPGLLSHIFTAKFVDALPFYRQEKQFLRLGIEISRSNMCGWGMKVGEKCDPLLSLLKQDMLSGPLISIDETTVQVMNEPGRSNRTKSYMWIFRGGDPEKPILLFEYHPTRSGSVASDFLKGYKGYVQTDGYSGYDFLDNKEGIIHVGCWAHVRRKFVDVVKSSGKRKSLKGRIGAAEQAVKYIKQLYGIEKKAKEEELGYDAIYEMRRNYSKPIIEEFHEWLQDISPKTPPQGLLGKAISYALNQWNRLEKYLDDGRLRPDNNLTENAIRPFVVGRKNWLFSGKPEGAKASAAFYSIIETAKANGLEPYQYLRYLFEKLPHATIEDDYRALLPYNVDKADILSICNG